jgi:RNA polymerase sigma-70 factor (ECF subfamily)
MAVVGDESLLNAGKLSPEDVRNLYDRHGPALLAYACSFVPDASAAEDAVHAVFVRLLGGHTEIPDSPVAYLYRAVRNSALNLRRNGWREASLDAGVFIHRDGKRESALALESALAELPEEQRQVVVMRIWSGLTLEEVAAATGVSLTTASSRYRYALEKLRHRLQSHEQEQRKKE